MSPYHTCSGSQITGTGHVCTLVALEYCATTVYRRLLRNFYPNGSESVLLGSEVAKKRRIALVVEKIIKNQSLPNKYLDSVNTDAKKRRLQWKITKRENNVVSFDDDHDRFGEENGNITFDRSRSSWKHCQVVFLGRTKEWRSGWEQDPPPKILSVFVFVRQSRPWLGSYQRHLGSEGGGRSQGPSVSSRTNPSSSATLRWQIFRRLGHRRRCYRCWYRPWLRYERSPNGMHRTRRFRIRDEFKIYQVDLGRD